MELKRLIKRIAKVLDKEKIPYMIIGGQAVLIYGEPRLTKDIDITLGIGLEGLEKVKNAIKKANLKILLDDIDDFVRKTYVIPAYDEKSSLRIDFILSFSEYEKNALERVKVIYIDKTPVKYSSLEDLIIHKIIAGRPRDLEDIKNILLKNPEFDIDYILKWLREFGDVSQENLCDKFLSILKEIKLN